MRLNCLLLLAACSVDGWHDVPTSRLTAEPGPGAADGPEWAHTVAWAARQWELVLPPGCLRPFEVGPDGHRVTLVDPGLWTWGAEYAGMEVDGAEYIDVRDDGPASDERIIVHELGHAMGLQHSDDPLSVMHPHPSAGPPTEQDADDATEALGCE